MHPGFGKHQAATAPEAGCVHTAGTKLTGAVRARHGAFLHPGQDELR